MAMLYFGLIPILGFWTYAEHETHKTKNRLIFLLTLCMFVCISLLPIVLPTAANYLYSEGWAHPTQQRFIENTLYVSRFRLSLLKAFRLITSLGWHNTQEEVGVLAYNFADEYQQMAPLVILSFYPIVLVIVLWLTAYSHLDKPNRRKLVSINALLLVTLFLTKVIAPPLSSLSQSIYNHGIIRLALRSGSKWLGIILVFLLTLEIVWLLHKLGSKRKIISALTALHVVYIVPALLIFARPINEAWITQVPDDYRQVAQMINSATSTSRVVAVPFTKHQAGYVQYDWGYGGPEPIYSLLDQPILDKFQNLVMPGEYVALVDGLRNNYSLLPSFAQLTGLRYVIHRKDLSESASGGLVIDENFSEAILEDDLHLILSTSLLDLYELNRTSINPLIYPTRDVVVVEDVSQSLDIYPFGIQEIDSPRKVIISTRDWCSRTNAIQPTTLIPTFSSQQTLSMQICNDQEIEYELILNREDMLSSPPLTATISTDQGDLIISSCTAVAQPSTPITVRFPREAELFTIQLPQDTNLAQFLEEHSPLWFDKCCPISQDDPLVYASAERLASTDLDTSSIRLEARNACSCVDFALQEDDNNTHNYYLINLKIQYLEDNSGQQFLEVILGSNERNEVSLARQATEREVSYVFQVPHDIPLEQVTLRFNLRNRTSDGIASTILSDVSVRRYPFEYAALQSQHLNGEVPYVEFRRVNPTLYHIRIRGATDPYILTFLNSFNQGWKVYTLDPMTSNDNWRATTSFLSETVREGPRTSQFLSPRYLRTWQLSPIPEENHLVVNGYANGWWVERTGDYDIILEFVPQRGIIVGSMACLVLFPVGILILIHFLKRA